MNRAERERKKHFFFLIVDDGGFSHTYPDKRGDPIDFSAYINLVRIAQRFNTQIVLSCTAAFFDCNRISERPKPHDDIPRIISLLEKHSDHIIVADHGYDHQFNAGYSEFYDYTRNIRRPVHEQEKHIDQSLAIYKSLGWPIPQLSVAPQHGWEPGVTDRIYAKRGISYLTTVLRIYTPLTEVFNLFTKNRKSFFVPLAAYPEMSDYLEILPRLGLGIPSYTSRIIGLQWLMAHYRVVPVNVLLAFLLFRRTVTQPHNYMAHIANFAGDTNYRKWCEFIEKIADTKVLLAKSFAESLGLFHAYNSNKKRCE